MKWFRMHLAVVLSLMCSLLFSQTIHVRELPKQWAQGEAPTAWVKDEVYVLEFWATWCGPCVKALPHMEALWQTLKSEGVHILGINVDTNRTAQHIRSFLASQPTPPTYPIALERGEGLSAKLGIKGIPHVSIVYNGKRIWSGHPAHLTVERLRGLRATGQMPPPDKASQKKPQEEHSGNPYQKMLALEHAADQAAERGDWAQAVALQKQALKAHPLQQYLEQPYLPEATLPASTHLRTKAPKTVHAEAVGLPLPADDHALTVVSLWAYPWWKKPLTQEHLPLLPGAQEAHTFTAPYRSITLVDAKDRAKTEALLKRMGVAETTVHYQAEPKTQAFQVDAKYKYPFVMLYLGEECLWVGALEVLPDVFKGPLLRPEAYRAALAAEAERAESSKVLFSEVREGRNLEQAHTAPLTPGTAARIIPYLFAAAYKANDVAAATHLFDAWAQRYADSPYVLEALIKLLDSWPDLALATREKQEQIYLTLGKHNPRIAPTYAVGHYMRAAECARALGDLKRARTHVHSALSASAQAQRLAAFQAQQRPLPIR